MKSYKQFINESKKSIEEICKKYGITNYTINEDESIDVDVYVDLSNKKLTTLPLRFRNVTGDFYCDNNNLTSLEGAPKSVGGNFYCSNNQLTSLEGCPENINKIDCENNKITDFKGVSEFFEGRFYCEDNPISEIYSLFKTSLFKTSKCIKWINEFDVIQGNKVILDRLEEVFHQLNMNVPENIKFKYYEII